MEYGIVVGVFLLVTLLSFINSNKKFSDSKDDAQSICGSVGLDNTASFLREALEENKKIVNR